ncbi:MAG: hypothetical protein ACI9UA_001256 [Pseudoalteromonas tetraodonis]|jgi:hypothetical protein
MKHRSIALALAIFFTFGGNARSRFAQPSLMPAERLLERAKAHLAENPEDAKAHYVVGRIHYLAFYNRASLVAVYGQAEKQDLPSIAPYWTAEQRYIYDARRAEATRRTLEKMGAESVTEIEPEDARDYYQTVSTLTQQLTKQEWKPNVVDPGISSEHATLALQAFDQAIDLEPDNPLYLLGKASLLEQASTFYTEEKPKRADPILSKITPGQIRDGYYRAFATGLEEALKRKTRPVTGLRSIASYEAGKAYERLCGETKDLSKQETDRLEEVTTNLTKLDKLRRGAITPIVFSTDSNAEFDDLIEPSKRVSFDLDGDGVTEEWPWVRNDTALLVWDPDRNGRILSGRQLFGSYTWQIPWENGYEPLAMLDRSGDGQLSGMELEGIRVWFDRDGDGFSDTGEVVDLNQLNIRSIRTAGTRNRKTNLWFNQRGISLNGGEALATWDWVPSRGE